MTKIVVLPNQKLCPEGAVVESEPGESICEALEKALAEDGSELLSEAEHEELQRGVEALNRASTEFAERRMNRTVQQALVGAELERALEAPER